MGSHGFRCPSHGACAGVSGRSAASSMNPGRPHGVYRRGGGGLDGIHVPIDLRRIRRQIADGHTVLWQHLHLAPVAEVAPPHEGQRAGWQGRIPLLGAHGNVHLPPAVEVELRLGHLREHAWIPRLGPWATGAGCVTGKNAQTSWSTDRLEPFVLEGVGSTRTGPPPVLGKRPYAGKLCSGQEQGTPRPEPQTAAARTWGVPTA